MTGKLDGRVAVVVGGGQTAGQTVGNGRAAALTYAREGAAVLVVDRELGSADETAALVRDEGFKAEAHQADITRDEDCRGIAEAAIASWGRIDVLHNNVGIVLPGRTEDLSEQDWRRGFDVNLTGMWSTCRYVLPHMREQGSGSVVNITSLASFAAGPSAIVYTTSKSAVNSMTRSLALDYAPHGVRVNAIAPGMVDTPMGVDSVAQASGTPRDEVAEGRAAMVPLKYPATGWDIAKAALFLVGDDAAFITGTVLPVDGGSALLTASAAPPGY